MYLSLRPALLTKRVEAQEKKRVLFLVYAGVLSDTCIVRMSFMRDVHLRNLDLNLIHPSMRFWRSATSPVRRNEVS
jgi:hypothetical protein